MKSDEIYHGNKLAIIEVTYDLLEELLKLPNGIKIKDVKTRKNNGDYGIARILVSGGGLPELEDGKTVPLANMVVHKKSFGVIYKSELKINENTVLEWNMDSENYE